MARPRKNQAGQGAKERIETAFWELLEEMPFRSISVRVLSQRAGVNHNTFYYHFASMEELALRLVTDNIPDEFFEIAGSLFRDGSLDVGKYSQSADLEQRFKRFRLIVRNGDAYLIETGKSRLIARLLDGLGIDARSLGPHDRAKLRFFIGGIVSVLSSDEIQTFPQYLALIEDGLADIAADVLHQILKR